MLVLSTATVLGSPGAILATDEPAAEISAAVEEQEKLIDELIEQLGHPKAILRDQAEKELRQIGPAALDALIRALEHSDIEIVMRAQFLRGTISIDWTVPTDSQTVKDLMKGFPKKSEDERRECIKQLAAVNDDNAIEALCRIVRFAESHRLSKAAALAIINMPWPESAEFGRATSIGKALGRNTRLSSKWLRTYLISRDDVALSLDTWADYIELESETLSNSSKLTDRGIVRDLLMHYIALLESVERTEEAQSAMKRLVSLETGEPESIEKLVEWLIEKKAWSVIDEVYARFTDTFQNSPLLLYTLAQARLEQGEIEKANEFAAEALRSNPGVALDHLVMAFRLQDRGLFHWAEKEYRQAITIGPARGEVAVRGAFLLSEMLHDMQREKAAAEQLQLIVDGMKDANVIRILQRIGRDDPGEVVSRMHYFWACHWVDQGDRKKQWEELNKAVAADPSDADVLIAMYRVPDLADDDRQRVSKLIKQAAAIFQHKIKAQPNVETSYNQYAWLIGNTEGDYELAVKYSLKSLELEPNTGGYLDTLGRCYYAVGKMDDAIKTQRRAVSLEPHSLAIRRQLEFFEAEAKKQPDAEPEEEPVAVP